MTTFRSGPGKWRCGKPYVPNSVVEFLQIASAVGFDPVRLMRDFRNELTERGVIEP